MRMVTAENWDVHSPYEMQMTSTQIDTAKVFYF